MRQVKLIIAIVLIAILSLSLVSCVRPNDEVLQILYGETDGASLMATSPDLIVLRPNRLYGFEALDGYDTRLNEEDAVLHQNSFDDSRYLKAYENKNVKFHCIVEGSINVAKYSRLLKLLIYVNDSGEEMTIGEWFELYNQAKAQFEECELTYKDIMKNNFPEEGSVVVAEYFSGVKNNPICEYEFLDGYENEKADYKAKLAAYVDAVKDACGALDLYIEIATEYEIGFLESKGYDICSSKAFYSNLDYAVNYENPHITICYIADVDYNGLVCVGKQLWGCTNEMSEASWVFGKYIVSLTYDNYTLETDAAIDMSWRSI
ncbi:MAG: hypothetical protein PHX51_01390 [Clostridia bacterium]|nr:hypothetical protein [Clostridia bacterium]